MRSLMVLRRLSDSAPRDLIQNLETTGQVIELEGPHAGLYVDNDRPNDADIINGIVAHTRDYAVADDWTNEDWQIHAHFSRLDRAEAAMAGATIKFAVNVEFEDEPAAAPKAAKAAAAA